MFECVLQCRPERLRAAEPSHMKRRTAGHTETTIFGDTRAMLNGLLRIGFLYPQQIIWKISDSLDYGPQNRYNQTSNYGSSNFDIRQCLSVSYVYELPVGRGKKWVSEPGIGRATLGGWQLSGVTSIQTGLPFSPILEFRSD
jgi:hypothetical protein